jgi:hypothetical protein
MCGSGVGPLFNLELISGSATVDANQNILEWQLTTEIGRTFPRFSSTFRATVVPDSVQRRRHVRVPRAPAARLPDRFPDRGARRVGTLERDDDNTAPDSFPMKSRVTQSASEIALREVLDGISTEDVDAIAGSSRASWCTWRFRCSRC